MTYWSTQLAQHLLESDWGEAVRACTDCHKVQDRMLKMLDQDDHDHYNDAMCDQHRSEAYPKMLEVLNVPSRFGQSRRGSDFAASVMDGTWRHINSALLWERHLATRLPTKK